MAHGLLQLVANNNSVEDLYLTNNPDISLFKTVYRRTTNFSKIEKDISFNKRLDFGVESQCKIRRFGDLLTNIYLVVDLPGIDSQTIYQTRSDVQTLLASYNIIWNFGSEDPDQVISSSDLAQIIILVNNQITTLTSIINQNTIIFTDVMTNLNPNVLSPPVTNSPNNYITYAMSYLEQYDSYIIEYRYMEAVIADIDSQTKYLSTSDELQYQYVLNMRNYFSEIQGTITQITIANGGQGYTTPTVMVTDSGSGSGAIIVPDVIGGVIQSPLSIVSGGSNYTNLTITVTIVGTNTIPAVIGAIFIADVDTTIIKPDATTNIPSDFVFLSNVEFGVYDINISSDSLLLFNIVIDQIYYNLENPIAPFIPPDTTPYKSLDSYFIFTKFLNANNVILNNESDVLNTKNLLVETIESNLVTNVVVLEDVFASMTNRFSITTFKRYIADNSTSTTTYQKIGGFTNLSLVQGATLSVNDIFTSYFTSIYPLIVPGYTFSSTFTTLETNGIENYYLNDLTTYETQFLIGNVLLFQNTAYQDFLNNDFSTLWSRLNIETIYGTITVTISGTSTSDAIISTITVVNGTITQIVLSSGGAGYTAPTVTIKDSASGTGATAIAVVVGGVIQSPLTITAGGSGYTNGTTYPGLFDPAFPNIDQDGVLSNMYLMDFIPLLVLTDIPNEVNNYAVQESTGSPNFNAFIINLQSTMQNVVDNILTYITTGLTNTLFVSKIELNNLVSLSEAYKATGDIIIVALLRPEIQILSNSVRYTLMGYIENQIKTIVNENIQFYLQAEPNYNTVTTDLNGIIESFFTPATNLPSYNTYKVINNYRLYVAANNVSTFTPISDAASSIWTQVQSDFITQVNNFFNNEALSQTYYQTNLGLQMNKYLYDIVYSPTSLIPGNYKIYNSQNVFQYIDYYTLISDTIFANISALPLTIIQDQIFTYINDIAEVIDYYLIYYEQNKILLNMKEISLNRPKFYYEESQTILQELLYIILNNPNYQVYEFLNSSTPTQAQKNAILQIANQALAEITVLGAMDIFNAQIGKIGEQGLFNVGITSGVNPYNSGTNLYNWYNTYVVPLGGNTQLIDAELAKFNYAMQNISAITLYEDIANITLNYNNFGNEQNVYSYMLQRIIDVSLAGQIQEQLSTTVNQTYLNILNYFNQIITTNSDALAAIDTSNPVDPSQPLPQPKLIIQIENLNDSPKPSFGYIKNLGQYMIDYVSIEIGGQEISRMTGEWLFLERELLGSAGQTRGYNIMIGNTPDIYTINTTAIRGRKLYIPLPFWFCKERRYAIPIVGLQYADTIIKVKMKKLANVLIYDSNLVFVKKPKMTCNILAEYIYVEEDERKRLATDKREDLIEILQYTSDLIYNSSNITFPNGLAMSQGQTMTQNTITQRLFFSGMCKELIWVMQLLDNITKTTTSTVLNYTDYSFNGEDMVQYVTIQFNGRDREDQREGAYYNFVQPYAYHTGSAPIGVHTYSFALDPEAFQPTGAANLSQIYDMTLIITLTPCFANYLINNNKQIRLKIYNRKENILRIASGLCGLLWFETH